MAKWRGQAKPHAARDHRRAWIVVAVGGSLWTAAHAANLLGSLAESTFLLLGAGAITATVLGLRWHRPALRWPWRIICGALVLFLFGGAARVALGTLGDLSSGRSLLPDMLTLPGYALFGTGLLGLARARRTRPGADTDAILDGVIAALAALTCAWVFFINPVLMNEHAPQAVRLLLATYPAMSVFLVAVTARMAFGASAANTPARHILLMAMSAMLAGDIVYMLVDAHLAVLPPTLIDLPYALAYVAFTAAVLHPSMPKLCEPPEETEAVVVPTRPRLAFVAVAFALPAFVTVVRLESLPNDRFVLAGIILTLTGMAIWRVFRALHAHARAETRLAHQATHDALTDLPNRTLAESYVSTALSRARTQGHSVAVLFLDIDRFKLVNDTLGHNLGDELLMAVARRLERNLRPGDFLARIGGDEFVIVLDHVTDVNDAMYMAERIRCCLHAPFLVRNSEMYASASVGVAFTNGADTSVDAETLIREADTAMYQAKDAGRDGVAIFDTSMRDDVAERLSMERELRHALELGQLSLHYQPVINLGNGQPVGVEALLRWSHPLLGSVSPARFIPIAEESGLILEIGEWVLRESCRQLADWRAARPDLTDTLHVAVNLSARQLRDTSLLDTVTEALNRNHLPAPALCLELTESLLMENPAAAAEFLATLRAIGVRLSIDDFGTGYSSLAYLKRFPVDHVKIDRTFIDGLEHADSSEESLVAAIIGMAGALGMTTVAEGVENLAQEERLRALGATMAQGFRYARPVPPGEVLEVLEGLAGVRPLSGVTLSA